VEQNAPLIRNVEKELSYEEKLLDKIIADEKSNWQPRKNVIIWSTTIATIAFTFMSTKNLNSFVSIERCSGLGMLVFFLYSLWCTAASIASIRQISYETHLK
jgi:hypothetical protein